MKSKASGELSCRWPGWPSGGVVPMLSHDGPERREDGLGDLSWSHPLPPLRLETHRSPAPLQAGLATCHLQLGAETHLALVGLAVAWLLGWVAEDRAHEDHDVVVRPLSDHDVFGSHVLGVTHVEPRLLQDLTRRALLKALAELEVATGQGPLPVAVAAFSFPHEDSLPCAARRTKVAVRHPKRGNDWTCTQREESGQQCPA